MVIEMFNVWYFLWMFLGIGATVGLYFLLKNQKPSVQKIVLFSLLAAGFLLHFLKMFIPPYSVDEARLLSDILNNVKNGCLSLNYIIFAMILSNDY